MFQTRGANATTIGISGYGSSLIIQPNVDKVVNVFNQGVERCPNPCHWMKTGGLDFFAMHKPTEMPHIERGSASGPTADMRHYLSKVSDYQAIHDAKRKMVAWRLSKQ